MYLFQRILRTFRQWFHRERPKAFDYDVDTLHSLALYAAHEQRSPAEIANSIVHDALREHRAQEENWRRWKSLTPREQEVAALICLGYTSRQIGAKLHITAGTVKTHAEHILEKFGAADRNMLRLMLSGWDFTGWDH